MSEGLRSYEVDLVILTKMTYKVEAYCEDEAYEKAVEQAERFGDIVETEYGYSVELIDGE